MLATIWLALAGFVVGEAGKTRHFRTGVSPRWAWPVWCAGLVACAIHIAIAMAHVHGWSHASAVMETARQTEAVYGVSWGGGVFVNYLFVAVWLGELVWWRVASAALFRPAGLVRLGCASLLPADRRQCRRNIRRAGAPPGRGRGYRGVVGSVVARAPAGIELTCLLHRCRSWTLRRSSKARRPPIRSATPGISPVTPSSGDTSASGWLSITTCRASPARPPRC